MPDTNMLVVLGGALPRVNYIFEIIDLVRKFLVVVLLCFKSHCPVPYQRTSPKTPKEKKRSSKIQTEHIILTACFMHAIENPTFSYAE